jgi:hypothetical protein
VVKIYLYSKLIPFTSIIYKREIVFEDKVKKKDSVVNTYSSS